MSEAPAFVTLRIDVDGPLVRLTLNRPEKLNPLGATTLAELAAAARWLDTQRDVRVVVVRGAGRAFSAGADLGSFSGAPTLPPREAADLGRQMADALEAMRPLSIAAIIPMTMAASPAQWDQVKG